MKGKIIVIIAIFLLTVALSGCNENTNNMEDMPPSIFISVNPSVGFQPLNVSIDINVSDSDGAINSLLIDYGDGNNTYQETSNHIYYAGSYTIIATAIDDDGLETTKEFNITVKNKDPTAAIHCDKNMGLAPLTVTFDGNFSNDLDGNIIEFYWDFGDGVTNSSTENNMTHTYESEGEYWATLTVKDNNGATSSESIEIVVSSSTFSLNPIADSMVDRDDAENNYGGSDLTIEYDNWGYGYINEKIAFIKFDLSDIPDDVTITSAKLKIYCYYGYGPTSTIEVHRSNNIDWDEIGITFQNMPSYTDSFSDSVQIPYSNSWYELDVKSYVQSSLASGKITLVLETPTKGGYDSFYSREGEYPPTLTIEIA